MADELDNTAAAEAPAAKRPKMSGVMRFFVVLLVIDFLRLLLGLIFESRDSVVYDPTSVFTWISIALGVPLLWMICCRFKAARPYALAYSIVDVLLCIPGSFTGDVFDFISFLLAGGIYLAIGLYFFNSKAAKAYLTEPFNPEYDPTVSYSKDLVIDRKSWPFWRNIGIYYCFFSLAGHWMESAFCMLIRAGIVDGEVDLNNTMLWRDWFYPFPMEGLAVALIAIFLYPLFRKLIKSVKQQWIAYVVSFIINGLVCVTIEYVMGMFVNADLQLWDYSNMPFNLNGMICLQNGVGFAFAASIICWQVYPLLERLFARLPKNVMNLIFIITLAMYAIPQTLYLIDVPLSLIDIE